MSSNNIIKKENLNQEALEKNQEALVKSQEALVKSQEAFENFSTNPYDSEHIPTYFREFIGPLARYISGWLPIELFV